MKYLSSAALKISWIQIGPHLGLHLSDKYNEANKQPSDDQADKDGRMQCTSRISQNGAAPQSYQIAEHCENAQPKRGWHAPPPHSTDGTSPSTMTRQTNNRPSSNQVPSSYQYSALKKSKARWDFSSGKPCKSEPRGWPCRVWSNVSTSERALPP
jgi:hypothetical protein